MKKEKKLLLFLALVLIGALLFSSVPASAGGNPGRGKSLAEARRALEQELLPLAGAGFAGITHSEAEGEVIVLVEDEQTKQRVPRSFNGYTVRTEVTGKIQALSTQVAEPLIDVSAERQGEVRPLVGGVSLSAYVTKGAQIYLYAGTLGMVTYDDKILSNTHVIAMNPETGGFLATGTPVLQPGTRDGGRSEDQVVGALEAYIPIDFTPGAKNYADAAIGSIEVGVNASPGEQFSEGGNYWIEGWTDVSTEDIVQKSGRTTGVTTGEVIHTNVSVIVNYGSRSAYFLDQIVVTQENWSFAAPGDSGSAVDKDGEFVGLLFAGSADCAVICKAEHIIDGLNITVEPPEGSLTISSTPGGNVTKPGKGLFLYDVGTVVELVAVPDEHYHFVEWTGNVSNISNFTAPSTNITMNDSYSITANFELDEGWYTLTISSTLGGNVTKPGEGTFVCGNSTGNSTVVELVAEPDEHYHFVEWTGNVSTISNFTAPSTNITMNDSCSITANFELDEGWYTLTISSTPGGNVTKPGEGTFVCGNSTGNSTVVELVADPDAHYHFVEWTGNVSNIANFTAPSTNITMNDCYSITANFELDEGWYTLTISSTESGTVFPPGEGTFIYSNGMTVPLFAQPYEGYEFVKWTGDVSTIADVYAASTTITMNSSYSITANFESWHPEPVALLMISSTSGGSVTTPGEGTFLCPLGSQVSLVAKPDEGRQFVKWLGDVGTIVDVYAASTTITMDSPYSIGAQFSGACFIATAAYGTPMAEEIQILRDFRDEYLLPNPLGQGLVDLYYRISPPIAEFITEHASLKPIVRAGLLPAVAMSTIAVNSSLAEKAAIIGLVALVAVAVAIWATRRRGRDPEYT